MGANVSSTVEVSATLKMKSNNIITGLGTEWPLTRVEPEHFQTDVSKFYLPADPRLQSMSEINQTTGIEAGAILDDWKDSQQCDAKIHSAEEVDRLFRQFGPPIAVEAAWKALKESNISPQEITHMVSVTSTNVGAPGYDYLVAKQLGIPDNAERILLSGVGCAEGLAATRVASQLADAASQRGRPARVLVVACEVCSIRIRTEMQAASQSREASVAPLLFGDGAASLVLCNSEAVYETSLKLFEVVDCRAEVIPHTTEDMSYSVSSNGFLLRLSKEVPQKTAAAVHGPFEELKDLYCPDQQLPSDFAWALHPGGKAIMDGVQEAMDLPASALESSRYIYRTRGNIASVTVLAVLDHMRSLPAAKPDVIAASFGPGLTVEMALLKRPASSNLSALSISSSEGNCLEGRVEPYALGLGSTFRQWRRYYRSLVMYESSS